MITRGFIAALAILFSLLGEATHIKGGQILYEHISGNTYKIIFIGYRDREGVLFSNGVVDFGDGQTFGGPDGETIPWEFPAEAIDDDVEQWQFEVQHTYQGNGTFTISYREEFRNEDVLNIDVPFSNALLVEALLVIDPLIGPNSAPRFRTPDLFGFIDSEYLTSFATVDPDGDSLAYNFVVPKQGPDDLVEGYRTLNNRELYNGNDGGAKLNRLIGNLQWNTTGLANIPIEESRDFTVAIAMEQWRDGFMIGKTVLDYNIEIWNLSQNGEGKNTRILFPEARCYTSKEEVLQDIIAVEDIVPGVLQVDFSTEDPGFMIDGLTVSDWNDQNSLMSITEDKLEIMVQYDPSLSAGEKNAYLTMRLAYAFDGSEPDPQNSAFTIAQSQTLYYREGCRFFSVLGVQSLEEPVFEISPNGVSVFSDAEHQRIIISSMNGAVLLERPIKGGVEVQYPFQRNQIYTVTWMTNGIMYAKKFMIGGMP